MAEFIKLYEDNPNPKEVKRIVKIIRDGGLVIYPSDTVYALGCDITDNRALERVAQLKGVKLEKANFLRLFNVVKYQCVVVLTVLLS